MRKLGYPIFECFYAAFLFVGIVGVFLSALRGCLLERH